MKQYEPKTREEMQEKHQVLYLLRRALRKIMAKDAQGPRGSKGKDMPTVKQKETKDDRKRGDLPKK